MKKIQLLPALHVIRQKPVNYEEMHTLKKKFIHLTETIPPIYLIKINNAYISPFGIVYKNGMVIKESVYSMFRPNSFNLSFYKKILLNKVKKIKGSCIVAHHSYYQNYYHFLLEILPRLFVLKDMAPTLTLIINKNIPSFIKEYIELFNFKEIAFIDDNEIAKAENVIFSTYLSRGLAYNEKVINEMTIWLRERLLDNSITNAPERIFISRNNAKYRRTINEDKVFSFLRQKGFVKFNLDDPTIKTQANFFKNAKYIIGSHGAGFSNMIFSTSCKLIIDIIHKEHPQDCFYNLANCFNIDYYYFQCNGTNKDVYPNNDDVIVDLAKFKSTYYQYIS